MHRSSRKLTHLKTLQQRRGYTSQGQLSMFWVAKYTAAQWGFKLHAECDSKSDTAQL